MMQNHYFLLQDFYNMHSDSTRTIIPQFATFQQKTDYTCGVAVARMVLKHYGIDKYSEDDIIRLMKIKAPPKMNIKKGIYGTNTRQLVEFFKSINFKVESSLDKTAPKFSSPTDFRDWVIGNLKSNNPIMVEWIDWGGHWQILIGYDTMGTQTTANDVLIFADPFDNSDHCQDGYYIFGCERFFEMWFDAKYLPEGENTQQWVIAHV